jgi:hypothetical protein
MFEIIWEKSNAKNGVVGKQVTAETEPVLASRLHTGAAPHDPRLTWSRPNDQR